MRRSHAGGVSNAALLSHLVSTNGAALSHDEEADESYDLLSGALNLLSGIHGRVSATNPSSRAMWSVRLAHRSQRRHCSAQAVHTGRNASRTS